VSESSSPEVIRRVVKVSGRVQGVFFRETLRRMAMEAGVDGWARNTRDGLEAALEGPRDEVERLVHWCRTGPPHAVVIHVQVNEEDPTGESNFRVR
jgi:acylphosphatase